VAIAIDATIVRILIVPSVMRLLGRANWWAPRPLALFHRWVGAGESHPASPQAIYGGK
jgi:RND superfamily putative drug exporter